MYKKDIKTRKYAVLRAQCLPNIFTPHDYVRE